MSTVTIPSGLAPASAPPETHAALDALAAGLDGCVPAKADDNLIIGTWNIAQFGDVTPDWSTHPGDSPIRNVTDVCCIAEIVSRFDVCAIQETKRNLNALHCMLRMLGPDWTFIVSDVTEGNAGNKERLCFVYDRRRVRASGLVGEVVIPDELLGDIGGGLTRQFARTPYAASFAPHDGDGFTLVTLHVIYGAGEEAKQRALELRAIAEWLADRAEDRDEFNRNFIALGDFNINGFGDLNWQALASTGLGPPRELQDLPRNISAAHGAPKKLYDQLAWFGKGKSSLTLAYRTAGYVRWTDFILKDARDDDARKAHVSDHFPLWAEFGV